MLIHTGHELILKYLDNFVKDASQDGDVPVSPGDVFNSGYFYQQEVIIFKMTLLFLYLGKSCLIEFENMLQQFEFLCAEEVVGIELEGLKPLLCEVYTWHEVRRQPRVVLPWLGLSA
jgi:hypothetical protein